MDRGIDWIVGAPSYPDFEEPRIDRAESWPEVVEAQQSGLAASRFRYAPERTPMLSAARLVDLETPQTVLMKPNARDTTPQHVRASCRERVCQSGWITGGAISLKKNEY